MGNHRMSPENAKLLFAYMQQAGQELVGRLPESIRHPNGRNPYAHVAICVKDKFGCTYKEIDDSLLEEVKRYIDQLVENPT